MKRNSEHFRGCLIGGAIGDAMGYLSAGVVAHIIVGIIEGKHI